MSDSAEAVWKALADPTRRAMLDQLAVQPRTTGELVEAFPDHCRTNVMKHLGILVEAELVLIRREGRTRWNYFNPVPVQLIYDRWIKKHVAARASSLARLKRQLESETLNPEK